MPSGAPCLIQSTNSFSGSFEKRNQASHISALSGDLKWYLPRSLTSGLRETLIMAPRRISHSLSTPSSSSHRSAP